MGGELFFDSTMFLGVMDVFVLALIGYHVIARRTQPLLWQTHGASISFGVYVFGHTIRRFIDLALWQDPARLVGDVHGFLWYSYGACTVFTVAGLIMMVLVLTSRVRWLWLVIIVFSTVLAAILSIWQIKK